MFAEVTRKVRICSATGKSELIKPQRFVSLTGLLDVESLSHLCKILYLFDDVLDILALHVRISDLIFHALLFLEEYDCETVGLWHSLDGFTGRLTL
jgi:hypothetical protein